MVSECDGEVGKKENRSSTHRAELKMRQLSLILIFYLLLVGRLRGERADMEGLGYKM